MPSPPIPPDKRPDVELTKLVYTLVLEPQRLHMMLQLLDESISPVFEMDGPRDETAFFDDLQAHFDNAFEMLQRREENEPNRSIARKLVDTDSKPSFLIDSQGRIMRSNGAATTELGVVEGERIDSAILIASDQQAFLKALKTVDRKTTDRFIGVFEMQGEADGAPWKMVMSRASDNNGRPVAHMASIKTRWQPHTGSDFSDAFKLTPAEQVIVQALVEGRTLQDVAEARGRSIGTVRNQAKRLLAKLDLRSQAELICLYAGFAQISAMPSGLSTPIVPPVRDDSRAHVFKRSNGSPLEIEFYGPTNGEPVLFFHPFMGGTLLSEDQKHQINARNLRLIMPLLPGYKGTTDADPGKNRLHTYATDLLNVLDGLGIRTCSAIGVNTSYIYALALAHASPDRLKQIVVANAAVPLKSASEFRHVSVQQRIPYLVSRYVPSLVKFYVRAVQAKLDAGYDEEYITKYYESSPIDQATILSPEIRSLARLSIVRAFQNGHEAPVQHLRMEVSDWHLLLDKVSLPLCLLNGDQDTEFPHDMVRQSMEPYPNIACESVENAGALMWYQQPGAVLDRLRASS